VPDGARVHDGPGRVLQLRTHSPEEALAALWDEGIRDVWLEGGPTVAAAFLAAGLVDEVYAYIAPALLGSGAASVGGLGIETIADIMRLRTVDIMRIGDDVRIHAVPADPPMLRGTRSRSTATGDLERAEEEKARS